jgi:hypothetical protein
MLDPRDALFLERVRTLLEGNYAMPVGTKRTWDGVEYVKVPGGDWVPVKRWARLKDYAKKGWDARQADRRGKEMMDPEYDKYARNK